MIFMIYYKPTIIYTQNVGECKQDSLQKVINQLQIDLENEEDGWDKKPSEDKKTNFKN